MKWSMKFGLITPHPQPPPETIVAATAIEDTLIVDAKPLKSCFHKYQCSLLFGSLLTVTVIAIVVLVTQMPMSRECEITRILTGLSSDTHITNSCSAQDKAKNWILYDDKSGLDLKNDKNRIIQ